MKNKQLAGGAILSYFSIFLNIICGLLYTPWMVQEIGQSQYGLYTLANSLITLFMVDFGLSLATSRYLSKYRAEGNQQKINDFLGAIYKLYFAIAAVILAVLVVLFFFIDGIYTQLTAVELQQFKVVYIISGCFAVINFPFVTFDGILTSYEKFIQLKLANVLYRVLLVVTTVIALLLGQGLYALVIVHAAAGLLTTLYKFIVIRRSVPVKVNFCSRQQGVYKEIFSFSIWVTLSTLAQRLIFNITPSVLGMVANSAAIAVFGVVTTLESYIYTIITAINGMFMPKISRILVEDERKLAPLMLKVGRFLYGLNGLIVAGFVVVGQQFIRLWMGDAYAEAYWGLLLVLVPGLFYNSLQIANTTMIATKKVNIQAMVVVITGVVNVLLSYPLSRYFGVIGSCLSIFIAYMVRAVILNIIYFRMPELGMKRFVWDCYLKMSLPVLLTVLLTSSLRLLPLGFGWGSLLIKSIVVGAVYLIFVWLIGLRKAEKQAVSRKIFSLLHR